MSDSLKINLVMLIDDSDIDLFIQRKVVELTGFASQVKAYINPKEALNHLSVATKEQLPELILLDLNMPIMDGFAVLQALEALPEQVANNCKVVVLTSSNSAKDRQKATDYHFVKGFLSKPLSEASIAELKNMMHPN